MIGVKANVLYEKAYAFGVRIVRAYQFLSQDKKEYVLSKQLLRCGTSIGANIAEANGAISDAEFSAKFSISYKECLETKYWLHLLHDTDYLTTPMFNSLFAEADGLAAMLFSSLRSTNRIRPAKSASATIQSSAPISVSIPSSANSDQEVPIEEC